MVARTCSEPGVNHERDGRTQTPGLGLLRHVGRTAHVLVGRVGAAANQGCRNSVYEGGVLTQFRSHLRDWPGAVGRVGAHQVGFQLRQVDLNDLVVVLPGVGFAFLVGRKQVPVLVGQFRDVAAACRAQVPGHALVVGENRGGRTQFGTHVGDGCLARGADGRGPWPEVFNDGVGATGNGQLAGQVQDHVLGGGPAAHLSGEVHADEAGIQDLPGQPGHNLHGVGATHTDGDGAKASAHGSVGVGTQHHFCWESVILEATWWMIPAPGDQKPTPYLADAVRRKL